MQRAAVELAKDWRSDRILRRLEAMLAVADTTSSLVITGTGDVLEPEYGIVAIGSGGPYAQAAARALLEHTTFAPADIVKQALMIAGDICVYTNQNHVIEVLGESLARPAEPANAGGDRDRYDIIVVGAGLVGLAFAVAAAREGIRVAVVSREQVAAVGARA